MTTYQDIVDYMNKNYVGDHAIIKHDGYYTMNTNDDDCSISINEDSYSINIHKDYSTTSVIINKGLNKLLADLLDTPVNQRNKQINSEIKHTVDPVVKESAYTNNLVNRLTSANQVIQAINSFLVSARLNSNPIMTIDTDIGWDNLNKVLKLYGDYNIRIINKNANSDVFNLLIEPK